MNPDTILAAAMLAALITYSLLAGADFGAGFWDLMCTGPRAASQRAVIEHAVEPVWESNHVWLVLLIVLLFSGFPLAFSTITTALAVPLFLSLFGIVLRGASFVFRAYFAGNVRTQLYWGKVFSMSSSMTPLFLGIVIGALSTDTVLVTNGISQNGFLHPSFRPFPLCVGVLSLSLYAYLSACYLTLETDAPAVQDDFRRRAFLALVVSTLAAAMTYVVAAHSASEIRDRLLHSPYAWSIDATAVLAAVLALLALRARAFRIARIAAAAQVALIVAGWGVAQYPYLSRPDLTISNSAAPVNVVLDLDIALAVGTVVLGPSMILLFSIFKAHRKSRPWAISASTERLGDAE